jgi:phosphoribosylanthranilate isomerase
MASPRIKICGVTTVEDALAAAALGVDAIGLNFYQASPRFVQPHAAAAILRALPPFVEPVGVFVNQPMTQVYETINALGRIRTIHWFGDKPELCDSYPCHFIPTFAIRNQTSLKAITGYLDLCRSLRKLPMAIAVDADSPGQFGGTGQPIPWNLLADFKPGVPLMLAGGLTPENVAEAIKIVQPYAVDVASGIESVPGRKNVEKMRRFVDNVHAASKT